MDPKEIAAANFDYHASRIEDAINKLCSEGSYSWSRHLDGGEDDFRPTDLLGGVPLFLEPSNMPSSEISQDSNREYLADTTKFSEEMEKAVDSVIERMSPSNSLRLSKEIVKNELSSWILALDNEEEKKSVEGYIMNEGGANSVSDLISENVFEYLAGIKSVAVDDNEEENITEKPNALTHITSVHMSASTSSVSSEGDSRVTVEKREGGNMEDDESELGFFRLTN